MSFIKLEKLLGEGSSGFVRRVGNIEQAIAGRRRYTPSGKNLAAMICRWPEVMVKITGFKSGGGGIKASLSYITRQGKLSAERADGTQLDKEDLDRVTQQWLSQQRSTRRASSTSTVKVRDCMNLMVSMPPATHPQTVLDAARAFAHQTFGHRHDYVFVQHTDEAHPHVHFVVNAHGFDGRKIDPKKADLQRWRESFAAELRRRDIEAAATPRPDRGVTLKPARQALLHLRKRGICPRVDLSQANEALDRVASGDTVPRPWETAIRERRASICGRYQAAASVLDRGADADDKNTAAQIASFLAAFAAPKTRMEGLIDSIEANAGANRAVNRTDPGGERSAERP